MSTVFVPAHSKCRGQREHARLLLSYPQGERHSEGRESKGDNAALADPPVVSRAIATRSMLRCNMSSRNPCCSAQYRASELEPAAPAPRLAAPALYRPRPAPALYRTPAPPMLVSPRPRAPSRAGSTGGRRGRGIEEATRQAPPRLGVLTRSVAEATGMSSRLARRRCRDV